VIYVHLIFTLVHLGPQRRKSNLLGPNLWTTKRKCYLYSISHHIIKYLHHSIEISSDDDQSDDREDVHSASPTPTKYVNHLFYLFIFCCLIGLTLTKYAQYMVCLYLLFFRCIYNAICFYQTFLGKLRRRVNLWRTLFFIYLSIIV
jgi:hypothetical protein